MKAKDLIILLEAGDPEADVLLTSKELVGFKALLQQQVKNLASLWAGSGYGLGDPTVLQQARDKLIRTALAAVKLPPPEAEELRAKLTGLLEG